jgi:aldehyde oxidoreductase
LVVAETEEEARNAAQKVIVEIEELPAYLNLLDAVAPGAIQIHEEMPNTYLYQPTLKGDGDTREIIRSSEHVVEGSFYSSREPHLSIEADTMQAYYDEDGLLTVQCKSQFLYLNLWSIPAAIGTTLDKMRFLCNPVGGSFGWSLSPASYALAAVAAMEMHAPVTLSMNYEEFMHFSGKRAPAYINGRLACDAGGKITALEFDTAIDHGAYSDNGQTLIERFCRFLGFPYGIAQVTGLSRMCCTNHAFGVAYRGYGAPQCTTAMESMMDMLAEKVGLSPWEIRYINAARPGDTMISGYPYRQYPMAGLLERAKPIYEAAVARARLEDTPEKRRGVGISCAGYNTTSGGGDRAGCKIILNSDGSFSVFNTWQDMGQGGDIGCVTHMVDAFREIGLRPEQVRLCFNDTKTCPNSGISGGSRSHYMNGHAIRKTAEKVLNAMRREDGTYRSYEDMVAEGLSTVFSEEFNLNDYGLVITDHDTGRGDSSPTYMYGVFISEVEVDVKTGKVKALSMISVDDVGVVGNRLAVDGQAYGGLSHCIGFALTEDYDDVKKHNNMAGAGVPTILDIPDGEDFQAIHVENPRADERGAARAVPRFFSPARTWLLLTAYTMPAVCGSMSCPPLRRR